MKNHQLLKTHLTSECFFCELLNCNLINFIAPTNSTKKKKHQSHFGFSLSFFVETLNINPIKMCEITFHLNFGCILSLLYRLFWHTTNGTIHMKLDFEINSTWIYVNISDSDLFIASVSCMIETHILLKMNSFPQRNVLIRLVTLE